MFHRFYPVYLGLLLLMLLFNLAGCPELNEEVTPEPTARELIQAENITETPTEQAAERASSEPPITEPQNEPPPEPTREPADPDAGPPENSPMDGSLRETPAPMDTDPTEPTTEPAPPEMQPETPQPKTPFTEDNGYIIMEMESVPIPRGHEWKEEKNLAGYTGRSFYRFTGNGICNGPANSPLRYTFRVKTAGTFELRLRAARYYHCVEGKPHNNKGECGEQDRTCISLGFPGSNGMCPSSSQCVRKDISNDAFVRIEDNNGSYIQFENQPGKTVGKDIKLFGGGNNDWNWTGSRALDISGKHNARWQLKAGVYTLVLAGRSKAFRIDRIVFFNTATAKIRGAEMLPETR